MSPLFVTADGELQQMSWYGRWPRTIVGVNAYLNSYFFTYLN